MNATDERTRSLWMTQVEVAPDAPRLVGKSALRHGHRRRRHRRACRRLIELTTAGRSVVVLDRGTIAGGITSRTTAHLAPVCDDGVAKLIDAARRGNGARCFRRARRRPSIASRRSSENTTSPAISAGLMPICFRRWEWSFKEARKEQDEEYEALRKAGAEVERAKGVPLERVRRCAGAALSEAGDVPSAEISEGAGGRSDRGAGRADCSPTAPSSRSKSGRTASA